MSLSTLKCIGLGILGLGGACSVAALSSSRVRKFIGVFYLTQESSISTSSPADPSTSSSTSDVSVSGLSEEDRQGQFLYRLSKEVFDALKKDSESDLSKHPKENVVKGLKDKFNGSLENEEDTWENFKFLCEEQKQREIKSGSDVNIYEARLCFLDDEEDPKGYLGNESNFDLGTSFKSKYSNANPVDKFDEGYSSDSDEAKNFKSIADAIIVGDYQFEGS